MSFNVASLAFSKLSMRLDWNLIIFIAVSSDCRSVGTDSALDGRSNAVFGIVI